eukprot:scaffold812_cov124-Cylindrotheca_fusiformis.AAC.8
MTSSSSSSSLQVSREIDYVLPESKSPSKIAYFENSSLAVIVAHPWGMLGGNLHNNVVLAVVQYFQRLGITTARFDFCGSQLGRGYRQIDQVKEMADILLSGSSSSGSTTTSTPWNRPTSKEEDQQQQKQQRFPTRILLVGYSYGSIICGSASAKIPQCIGTVWIAPPFGEWILDTFPQCKGDLKALATIEVPLVPMPPLEEEGTDDSGAATTTTTSASRGIPCL